MKLKAITVDFRGTITTHLATHTEKSEGLLKIMRGEVLVCCYVSMWAKITSTVGAQFTNLIHNGIHLSFFTTKVVKMKGRFYLLFGSEIIVSYHKNTLNKSLYTRNSGLESQYVQRALHEKFSFKKEFFSGVGIELCKVTNVEEVLLFDKKRSEMFAKQKENKKKKSAKNKVKAPKVDKGTAYADWCKVNGRVPSGSHLPSKSYQVVQRPRPSYIPRPKMPAERHGGGWHWVEGHWRSGSHVCGHWRGFSWVDEHWRSDTWIEGFWRFTPYY